MGEIGEPQRRYVIVPREIPVPMPPDREDAPVPTPAPEHQPERVP
jgi:hypothetical protein